MRTSKTVNGITTNYTTIDGRITSQNDGTNFLYFRYDSNNELVGVQKNGTEYIYLKNLQGDVVSILDTNGQSVVNYTYDAWGKITVEVGRLIIRVVALLVHFNGGKSLMKRKFAIVIFTCFVSVLLLSSCSGGSMFSSDKEGQFFEGTDSSGNSVLGRYSHDDQSDANAKMDKILEAIKKKDKDALKAMFSKKTIAKLGNFDQSVTNLFDYFQGEFQSYNDWNAVGAEQTIDNGNRNKILNSTYDVKTSKQEYRFAIQDYTIDTTDSDNVGIHSLYIIKMENDTDPQFAYRGDDKNTPGINIGIKNVLPKEDDSISAVSVDD